MLVVMLLLNIIFLNLSWLWRCRAALASTLLLLRCGARWTAAMRALRT
jgi:hypothetical protein